MSLRMFWKICKGDTLLPENQYGQQITQQEWTALRLIDCDYEERRALL
ncbi:unnamed protein product [Amoebophrya sp. A25]|nr:unnamed protein product [Amoebophrya sp. A25]|eukprot:GSA25T00021500001.1